MRRIQEVEDFSGDLPKIFDTLEGPYAFVYLENRTNTIYFARDPLGRRSLLIHRPTQNEPYLLLASVSCGCKNGYEFDELSTEGIFRVKLGEWAETDSPPPIQIIHSYNRASQVINKLSPVCPPMLDPDNLPNEISECVDAFVDYLRTSVELRVSSIPPPSIQGARLAVLFSGGVDCSILALLADRIRENNTSRLRLQKRGRGNERTVSHIMKTGRILSSRTTFQTERQAVKSWRSCAGSVLNASGTSSK